jgi:predicted NBD/HSP70 family sugar kinase
MALKNDFYKKSIIKALYYAGTLSCTELSVQISKSYTLVVKTLEILLSDGLVIEKGYAESSGGRRSMTYSLPADSFYTVAVAMDQFVTRICIYNALKQQVGKVQKLELLLDNQGSNHGAALEVLTAAIQKTITTATIAKEKIIGIGIAMPGFINAQMGANYTFMGEGITTYLQNEIGLPAFIENDSTAIGLAEYHFGKAQKKKNVMVINLSWGIGLGMLIDGHIFRGANGFAGEFSHIPVFKNGTLCSCGKTGCLETETSLLYMIKKALQEIGSGRATLLNASILESGDYELKSSHFLEAARRGDSLTVEIVSDVAYNIGRGIAILIHLFNPESVILSGRCSSCATLWPPPIKRALNEFCIPRLLTTTLEMSSLGHNAELIGASILAIDQIKESDIQKITAIT